MRSRSTKYILGALSLFLLMLLIGSATAETIIGNAQGESHERIEAGPNYVLIEKFVHHELKDGAKIKDSASGPLSATNTDPANGIIEVSLDAYKLDVSGKVSGTGTAILDAHVLAEGTRDNENGVFEVSTDIGSSVDLNSGEKGKAEGKASASGEGFANQESFLTKATLTAGVEGSTTASGKVSSGSTGELFAEGGISGEAFMSLADDAYDAKAEIASTVRGTNNAEGSTSADGSADASLSVFVPGPNFNSIYSANADAATTASGKGSGIGEFEVDADAESQVHAAGWFSYNLGWSYYSEVEAEANSEGAKGYSATTSARSSTGMFAENSAFVTNTWQGQNGQLFLSPHGEVTTAGTATVGTSQKGVGEIDAESEIEAGYKYIGELGRENLLALDGIAGIGFSDVNAYHVSFSAVRSEAEVRGTGSAMSNADGSASEEGNYPSGMVDVVRSSAGGKVAAGARATGTGSSDAWANIESDALLGITGGEFVYFYDLGLPEAGIDIPEIPELPDAPQIDDLLQNDNLLGSEIALPIDGMGMLQDNQEFRIPDEIALPEELSGEGAIELPTDIWSTSLSIIESGASASGNAKKDSASASSFVKKGATEGFAHFSEVGYVSDSMTSSEGSTATSASANEVSDPASEAVITSISAQGIDFQSGLDASLIGSASFADGIKGTTSGIAEGTTSAEGTFTYYHGPTSATGVAHTTATTNGGVSVAAAGLGSADFEFSPPTAPFANVLDISLLGSAAGTVGTGSAAADATGTTEASGIVIGSVAPGETLLINSLSNVTGTASVKTNTNKGIAAAVDGLVAGEFVDAYTALAVQPSEGGDITGGSLVGELVFAQRFDSKGLAKASASASGTARTNGLFNVTRGVDPLTGQDRFVEGKAVTQSTGSVAGKADVINADPLSASVILAFTDVNGEDSGIEWVYGDVYGAGLVGSTSVASGNSGSTSGSADGAATVTAGLKINGTTETVDEESEDQALAANVVADGAVATSAAAKGGLAASVAVEGALASVGYDPTTEVGFNADLSDISLLLAGSTAFGTSSSTASASADEIEADSGLGIFAWEVDDPVDYHTEGLVTAHATVDDGSTASSSAKANNGFAVGLSGIGSGAFTDFTSFEEREIFEAPFAADADITSVSLIIGGAAAVSATPSGLAKADATASGTTDSGSGAADEFVTVSQTSEADGTTNTFAETKAKSDPVSLAAILAFSDLEAGMNPDTGYTQDLASETLLASGSFTTGDMSATSGSADGSATTEGSFAFKLDETDENPILVLSPSSATTADVTSSASATKGGVGLSAAGAGSLSIGHTGGSPQYLTGQDLMFAYAGGEGSEKSSTVNAASGYKDVESVVSGSLTAPGLPVFYSSTSDVSGDGMANVKVNGENVAKALAFGTAESSARDEEFAGSHYYADVAFGTQAMGSDNAPIEAHAAMEDVGVHASSMRTVLPLPPIFINVGYEDGVSYIDLLPKKNLLNWDTYAIGDPNPQVNIGGAAVTDEEKAYNLNTGVLDPNYAVWTKFAGGVSSPPLPPTPDFFILPGLPPF